MVWCSYASTNKLLMQLIHRPKCLFWVICTVPSTMGTESKQPWSHHLRPWQARVCSPWPMPGLMHHFCHTENRTLDTTNNAEGGAGPKVGSEQPDIPSRAEGTEIVLSNISSRVQTAFWKTSFQCPQRVQKRPSHFPAFLFMIFISTVSHRPRENGFSKMFLPLVH